MSMNESVARLAADRGGRRRFFWWDGEALRGLFEKVERTGIENVRIEIAPGAKPDGTPELWIRAVDKNEVVVPFSKSGSSAVEDGDGWENFSHVCPPDCP